jgi:hypothetical protein
MRLNRILSQAFFGRNLDWDSLSGREAVCPPSTLKPFGAIKCIVRKGVILQEYEAVCLADVDGAAPLSVPNLDDSDKKAGRSVRLEELERSSVRTWKAVSRGESRPFNWLQTKSSRLLSRSGFGLAAGDKERLWKPRDCLFMLVINLRLYKSFSNVSQEAWKSLTAQREG